MLDKILDKLGIYDLLAVLLAGIIISVTTLLICEYIEIHVLDLSNIDTNTMLIFLLISYFIGLVFQEIGSSIEKQLVFKDSKLLKETVKGTNSVKILWIPFRKKNDYVYITQKEWNEIESFVTRKLRLRSERENYDVIYNYCKYHVMQNPIKIDKDQSMSAMGRSLSYYFFFCTFILYSGYYAKGFCCAIWDFKYLYIITLCDSLFAIFLLRGIRFAKMRFSKILRAFYYDYIATKPNHQSSLCL